MGELDKAHITGKELGNRLDLKKSPLTDWKNGKSKPTLEQLIRMCDIFATSADYLLFGIKPINTSTEYTHLLSKYEQLSKSNQEEIIAIIELKLQRELQEAVIDAGVKNKSSQSTHGSGDSIAAV